MYAHVSATFIHSGFSVGDRIAKACSSCRVSSQPIPTNTLEGWSKTTISGAEDSVIEALSILHDNEGVPLRMLIPDEEQLNRDTFRRQVQEGERFFKTSINVKHLANEKEFVLELSGPSGTSLAPLRAFSSFVFRSSSPTATHSHGETRRGLSFLSRPPPLSLEARAACTAANPNYPQYEQNFWTSKAEIANCQGTDPKRVYDIPTTATTDSGLSGAFPPPRPSFRGLGLPYPQAYADNEKPGTSTPMAYPHGLTVHGGCGATAAPVPPVGGGNSSAVYPAEFVNNSQQQGISTPPTDIPFPPVQQHQQTATPPEGMLAAHFQTLPPLHFTPAGEIIGLNNRSGASLKYDRVTSSEGMKTVRIRGTCRQVDAASRLLYCKLASWTARATEGPESQTVWVPDVIVNQ
eukprot:Cvel_9958.t1-p1 / transcript=Cvel_9958.t1 / gene=Cvel_9958 / organism=Chromera_velia_CCMP2878 / gene_product=hypothetical protein / transcript_product=hypothetical protein / location=Cvel_scaffold589:77613-79306(+) / protein_length=405 / sequence_SO=supercontig / SO=protein_coding / is_pseudo=false